MNTKTENTSTRDFAKFGGFQFSHEMEVHFAQMVSVMEDILKTKLRELPHPTGILLANMHHSAKAVLCLPPGQCLNEAYLILRVLVDTGVTYSYLLVADEADRKKYFDHSPASSFLRQSTPQQLIDQAKSLPELDIIPSHRLNSIKERIEFLAKNAGVNRDAWLIVVAAIFPHSSEVLCGGPYAYAFQFLKESSNRRVSDNFCMLYFLVNEFLCQVICLSAKHVKMPDLKEKAESINNQAVKLMHVSQTGIPDPVTGAWSLLDRTEYFATLRLADDLQEFEDVFQLSYEAGIIIPSLPHEGHREHYRHAALYLRRALNDFRSVWVLLEMGYTSQASTCAGSLFETCLATICLLKPEKIIEFEAKLSSATGNDFPWKPMHMAKTVCAEGHDLDDPSPEYQNAWRALYSRYAWLSKIRHSTFQSVIHDSKAAMLDSGYAIIAIPNSSDADLPVKIAIAFGAIADLHNAINSWVRAFGFADKTGVPTFDERLSLADQKITSLMQKHSMLSNPISIQRTEFMRRHPPIPTQNNQ